MQWLKNNLSLSWTVWRHSVFFDHPQEGTSSIFQTPITNYQPTRRHFPEDSNRHSSISFIMFQTVYSIIVNDYQQDTTILAYLFIPNHLYMFRAMSSPNIRSTWLYLQLLILSTGIAASWCHGWDGTDL